MQHIYPEKHTDSQMRKFISSKENELRNKRVKSISFAVTYHPLLRQLAGIIPKQVYLLHMNNEVKKIFTSAPMVSFRNSFKISSYTVDAKMGTFTSAITGKIYKANLMLNCDDKCLIQLLRYNHCRKQYVGETTDSFWYR